ncbi:MAG: cytochrome c biogenesis protein [Chloroflexi bacterium]|nr:cytochrome c biogenesis protein [Chloroflexota bacterium]
MSAPSALNRSRGTADLGWDRSALVLTGLSAIGVLLTLVLGLIVTPKEAVEGNVFRIFYIHVGTAWNAYAAFFILFVASVLYLWKGSPVWDRCARISAEIGLLFTTVVLLTGSIWGRPVWGVWWTWDARLTTTLVLWFMDLAYLLLRSYTADEGRAPRYAAVVGIITFIDVPIVQFSVSWWRTLHPQADVLAAGHLAPSMLVALLVSVFAFTIFGAALFIQRLRLETLRDELRQLRNLAEELESDVR